jgi:hypothetical protein
MTYAATMSVYSGRERLGALVERGERFEAITSNGESLGLFNNERAAGDALEIEHRRRRDPTGAA